MEPSSAGQVRREGLNADESIRVAIAHEWIVRWGGSERVVEELLSVFPGSRVLTSVLDPEVLSLRLQNAEPSFLQRFPHATAHHEWLLPLMPLSWKLRRPLADVDLVISSSHACAKAVKIDERIPHLCYCHTPMRYAWLPNEERSRFPSGLWPAVRALMWGFRRWDRSTAAHVTAFVANSEAVADRIRRFYGRSARVIHPPVRTHFFTPGEEVEDFFLYVGRLTGYKRPELALAAFADSRERLVMVGSGPLKPVLASQAGPNVTFIDSVDDTTLRSLYRRARALVFPAEEDFGIAMAEAQACGTPVIGLDRGGARDIVRHGESGWLAEPTINALQRAMEWVARTPLSRQEIAWGARRFSIDRFQREIREAALAAIS